MEKMTQTSSEPIRCCAAAGEAALNIVAAGSLRQVLPLLAEKFIETQGARLGIANAGQIRLTFAPSGILRKRIESENARKAALPDLFLSADCCSPRALLKSSLGLRIRPWVRNGLSLVFPKRGPAYRRFLELQKEPSEGMPVWLRLALSQGLLIGTSTPVADPGGDYAMQLFENAGKYVSPSGTTGVMLARELRAKSIALVGGAHEPSASMTVLRALALREADLFVSYLSNRKTYESVLDNHLGGLFVLPIPESDSPDIRFCVWLGNPKDPARAFESFLFSAEAKAILTECGFCA